MAQTMRLEPNDIHVRTYWLDGIWAGIIAGLAFMMLEMALVWMIKGESPWGPPHMMAAMVLGERVLPPPGTYAPFDMGIMMTAMMVHLMMSMVYGLIGAWLVHRFDLGISLLIGAVYGWAIYTINFVMIAPVMFPWFNMARGLISIFSHVMFGVVLAGAYVVLRRRHLPRAQR